MSEDLGGFREIIEPGFFRAALRRKPDVRLLFNHNENYVLGRTASGTLELREDNRGLHVFGTVDKTIGWVSDLRKSMQRGDIDQMSFAFTLTEGGDDWAVSEDGTVVRTLRADGAADLFDASVVTYPAYKSTEVSMRSVLDDAIHNGRLPVTEAEATPDIAPEAVGDGEQRNVEPSEAGEPRESNLDKVRAETAAALAVEQDRLREANARKYRLTSPKE
jgi:HK97 family phage prohead protease